MDGRQCATERVVTKDLVQRMERGADERTCLSRSLNRRPVARSYGLPVGAKQKGRRCLIDGSINRLIPLSLPKSAALPESLPDWYLILTHLPLTFDLSP